ncbi:hypothetical protein MLD52_18000 [Puniceicoccaceae bacterium K14]|nr:hypothetical protein [Puniceicoccaceae bacterium K14]
MFNPVTDPTLWQKLERFQLDEPDAQLPFSKRLAKEKNWSDDFTLKAIDEYKRFLYLAVVADHPVTPSETVDAVWHLHLCYTRSYWGELCPKILGRNLHHNPSQGGADQSTLFRNQYQRTLESYRREFGTPPPAEIWLKIENQVRVNPGLRNSSSEYNISISKKWTHVSFSSLIAGLLVVGCSKELSKEDASLTLFIGGVVLFLILLTLFKKGGKGGGGNSGGNCTAGCDSGCGSNCGGGD